MATQVYDANTGDVVAEYTLPPIQSLVAAWEQFHSVKNNHNTWEYAKKLEADAYPLKRGKYGWCLGKFWVRARR